jgi:hypothetical protein
LLLRIKQFDDETAGIFANGSTEFFLLGAVTRNGPPFLG